MTCPQCNSHPLIAEFDHRTSYCSGPGCDYIEDTGHNSTYTECYNCRGGGLDEHGRVCLVCKYKGYYETIKEKVK
jgi:hypothetical protein